MPVLYDLDCGFCRASLALLLLWDRRRSLRPIPLQSDVAAKLLPGTGPEERLEVLRVVPPGGAPLAGGEAFTAIFDALPAGRPLAALTARFPRAVERGYRMVARNRPAFSRAVPRALSRRADALVRARSDAADRAALDRAAGPGASRTRAA